MSGLTARNSTNEPATTHTVATALSTAALSTAALVIAAIAFALYPILRSSADEVGLSAAALYARPAWLLAHCLGMIGFLTAAWGLGRIDRLAGRLAFGGTVLVLPYYGAEAYGLHAIGVLALRLHDPSGIPAADMFRYQPVAITTFGIGLLLFAAAGVRLLFLLGRSSLLRRVGLMIAGLALIAYLPQFFLPIQFRIAHGVVFGIGLLALAWTTARQESSDSSRPATRSRTAPAIVSRDSRAGSTR